MVAAIQHSTFTKQHSLNIDLDNVHSWCESNALRINPSKTNFMVFHSPQLLPNISSLAVTLDGYFIHTSASTKFLGVTLDKHLKFSEHAQSLTQKVSFGIHVIIKTRPYFSTEILLSLYYAFIHSHLSYCLSSWGNTYWSHIGHLERLQKQALRLITFNPFLSPSAPIFRSLNILPLRKLVSHKILIIMFRVLNHELYISSFSDVLLVNTNNTRFSTNRNLLLPKIRTNYGRMTTRFSCVTLWNKLPFDLKSCTMHSFCKRLKIELLNDL